MTTDEQIKEDGDFKGLAFPHREVPSLTSAKYRVYSNAEEYTAVVATSALDAIKASDIKTPFKIIRESLDMYSLLKMDSFADNNEQDDVTEATASEDTAADAVDEAPAEEDKSTEAQPENTEEASS